MMIEEMLKALRLSKFDYHYNMLDFQYKVSTQKCAQLKFQLTLKIFPCSLAFSFIVLLCTVFLAVFEISAAVE